METIPQTRHLIPPVNHSVRETVFIFLSHWPKGSFQHIPKPHQTAQDINRAIGYPVQPGGETLSLKIPLMPLNMEKLSGAHPEVPPLLSSMHGA